MATHHHTVSTFQYNASAKLAPASRGDRIEVTHSGREYVSVLSTAELRSLEHATERDDETPGEQQEQPREGVAVS